MCWFCKKKVIKNKNKIKIKKIKNKKLKKEWVINKNLVVKF